MLSTERRREILRLLHAEGHVTLQALADKFGVSIMTVRRDLKRLEQEGKARRVHGGAVATGPLWDTEPIEQKSTVHREEKDRIAGYARTLIVSGGAAFLDAGSTAMALARRWLADASLTLLTVCTPDLQIAGLLARDPRFTVLTPGGRVDGRTGSLTGPFAEQVVRQLRADVAFIGCDGATLRDGAMSTRPEQAVLKRVMMECSLRSVLLADASKFGRVSLTVIRPLVDFDVVITDVGMPDETAAELRQTGVEVVRV